jgi:pyruvate dehydrogenase (quinone)
MRRHAGSMRSRPEWLPHITLDQAKKFTSMLVKGDPEEASVLLGTAKELLASVTPGRRK